MAKWIKNFSWENLFDGIAAKSPDFVKIAVVAGKSFLYYHGLTRAAALTYTTILAVIPLLILLTSITLAAGFGNFISDYLPHLLDMFSLDWPTEPIVALIENAEHVPIGKLGIIGAAGLFVTFILAFGSLESNFNVVWENKTSRTLWKQTCIYTPFLLILASFIGLYAGFVNHVQEILSTIIIDGFHFSHSFLTLIINAFWYVTFHVILLLFIFMMLYALPSRPDKKGVYTKRLAFHIPLREDSDAHPDGHGEQNVHLLRFIGVHSPGSLLAFWHLGDYFMWEQPGLDHLPLARGR